MAKKSIKLDAIRLVFPDLKRPEKMTNEQASQKIEAEAGIKIALGYLKRFLEGIAINQHREVEGEIRYLLIVGS